MAVVDGGGEAKESAKTAPSSFHHLQRMQVFRSRSPSAFPPFLLYLMNINYILKYS
jgi:hypothetical protein